MEQQKNAQANEAEGKSRGGLSTKIRAAVDALGTPVRFILAQGHPQSMIKMMRLLRDSRLILCWLIRVTTPMIL